MNRELTNRIRYVIEDLIPPALRDSWLFRATAKLFWSDYIDKFAAFRERGAFLTDEEYDAVYRDFPRVHEHTDNSEACIARITRDVVGGSVCDVGCGGGALIRRIKAARPEITQLTGVDFQVDKPGEQDGITFLEAKIEALPFPDGHFDTVVCTHVIEHILDNRQAIAELRRIAKRRLIIVVPREREYRYTFNPHLHFFPYTYSFLRVMVPVPDAHLCEDIHRDIYYREDRS
jgi:SAM-dependent methyltransferase